MCDEGLVQYFGLGSKTRKTATGIPDPYGIEFGNPADAPAGWMLNVHAIDTRGAVDKLGCTECRKGFGVRARRSLYLRMYMDWDASIVPVQIYVLDITDMWREVDESTGLTTTHPCLIEYDVEA
ncbi:hypothetical protein AAHA92_33169 [Salvia divinorum]|uniref:Uncharacterized protein n=1 Tax=Salvia divinorum TaxID=28513 RepID=A0ABD1FN41_SALDI